jgi:glycosyltransferase involved in cell wall biosynthesis
LYPLISVVIPAYNRETTIGYCLETVLRQSYKSIEIIVVDDGSIDGTVAVVRSFSDQRIRLIETKARRGAQAARNAGITAAAAQWIAFQDSDDEWLPEKLEKQLVVLKAASFDARTLVHCSGIMIDEGTGMKIPVGDLPAKGDDAYRLLLSTYGPMFQGMLVSKSALTSIGLLDEAVPSFQEWDTAIRLAKQCSFIYIPEPLFIYRQHSGPTISKDIRRAIEGYDFIINKFRDAIIAECGTSALHAHNIDQARRCMNNGLWQESKKYIERLPSDSIRRHVLKLFIAIKVSPEPLYRLF